MILMIYGLGWGLTVKTFFPKDFRARTTGEMRHFKVTVLVTELIILSLGINKGLDSMSKIYYKSNPQKRPQNAKNGR